MLKMSSSPQMKNALSAPCAFVAYYSRTSEERTLWDGGLCPLFGGFALLGGCLIFALYTP